MKPGHRTSEFVATVALCVALGTAALVSQLSPRYAAIASAISIAAYAISRGIAKQGTPGA